MLFKLMYMSDESSSSQNLKEISSTTEMNTADRINILWKEAVILNSYTAICLFDTVEWNKSRLQKIGYEIIYIAVYSL